MRIEKGLKAWIMAFIFFIILIIPSKYASSEKIYRFERMWPTLQQPWYFYPLGIAVDQKGYIYIVDSSNHRIQKFTSDGQFVATWGTLGTGDGEFKEPRGIAVDNSGFVYVTDMGNNHRLQKFTVNGQFVAILGSIGSGERHSPSMGSD